MGAITNQAKRIVGNFIETGDIEKMAHDLIDYGGCLRSATNIFQFQCAVTEELRAAADAKAGGREANHGDR